MSVTGGDGGIPAAVVGGDGGIPAAGDGGPAVATFSGGGACTSRAQRRNFRRRVRLRPDSD